MLIYVDDIILTGNNESTIQDLILKLGTEFALKDLGWLHYFLGIEVQHCPNRIVLSPGKYTIDLLAKAKMLEASYLNTPMAISTTSVCDDHEPVDPTPYRSIVGSLQYLTLTRPDIVHAVNKLCQHMERPTMQNWRATKLILRYIKGTLHFGITFLKTRNINLYAFCDADWGGCPDTRRSTSGYCVFLGSNCISWASKKQPMVSRSSTEAEYRAMATATAELTWITFLLRDIGLQLHQAPQLFCDNISALHMTINTRFHARTKHIELNYHFVREKVVLGTLITRLFPSKDQITDIFTKPLPKASFQLLRCKLGVQLSPHSSLRDIDIHKEEAQQHHQINSPSTIV